MYYELTFCASDIPKKIGDSVVCGSPQLNIGQDESCDLLLPESQKYEPQVFAVVLQSDDSQWWYIVRRSDLVDIRVNDHELGVCQKLNDGDKLTFNDGEHETVLQYNTREGKINSSTGIDYREYHTSRALLFFTIIVALAALGIVGYTQMNKDVDLYHSNLEAFEQSIYCITTDSVYLMCDTIINDRRQSVKVDSIYLEKTAVGTCFLTDSGLFVTARHCIEPWINDESGIADANLSKMSPEIRMSILAETFNMTENLEKYYLRSHCVIYKGLERYEYYSTDFFMNKSRDKVIQIGGEHKPMYWRTIIPIASRRDMELGDFAYLKFDSVGAISLASIKDIQDFDMQKNDHDIVALGYPLNDNRTENVKSAHGILSERCPFDDVKTPNALTGCLLLSGQINPGNSGGPVLAKVGKKIKAIGIVSKVDKHAGEGTFWAVPTTEVLGMCANGDSVKVKEQIGFRR